MAIKLTPKREAFVQAYHRLSNQRKAYREAFDCENSSDACVDVAACRLLQNAKVKLRLQELQEKASKRNEITVDTITAMLREDRDLARDIQQPSAAVAAAMGLAKVHGLIIDKSKLSGDPDNPVVTEIRRTIVDSKTTDTNDHHQRGSAEGIQAPANTRPI